MKSRKKDYFAKKAKPMKAKVIRTKTKTFGK